MAQAEQAMQHQPLDGGTSDSGVDSAPEPGSAAAHAAQKPPTVGSTPAQPNRVLFFAKVSPTASADEVSALFAAYGAVDSVNLFRAWATARSSKGCGLVTMATLEAAEAARAALSGKYTWQGADAPIVVEFCCPSKLGAKAASAAAAKAAAAAERAAASEATGSAGATPGSPAVGSAANARKRNGLRPSASFTGPTPGAPTQTGAAAALRYLAMTNRAALAGHHIEALASNNPPGLLSAQLPQRSYSFPHVTAAGGGDPIAGPPGLMQQVDAGLQRCGLSPLMGSPLSLGLPPSAGHAQLSSGSFYSPSDITAGGVYGGSFGSGMPPAIPSVRGHLEMGMAALPAAPAALPVSMVALRQSAMQLPSAGAAMGRLPGNSTVDFVNVSATSSLVATQLLTDQALASSSVDSWSLDSGGLALTTHNWSPGCSITDNGAQSSPPLSVGTPSPPLRPMVAPPLPPGLCQPQLYASAVERAVLPPAATAAGGGAAPEATAPQMSLPLTLQQAGAVSAHVSSLSVLTGCAISLRPAASPPTADGVLLFELVAAGAPPQLQHASMLLSRLLAPVTA